MQKTNKQTNKKQTNKTIQKQTNKQNKNKEQGTHKKKRKKKTYFKHNKTRNIYRLYVELLLQTIKCVCGWVIEWEGHKSDETSTSLSYYSSFIFLTEANTTCFQPNTFCRKVFSHGSQFCVWLLNTIAVSVTKCVSLFQMTFET